MKENTNFHAMSNFKHPMNSTTTHMNSTSSKFINNNQIKTPITQSKSLSKLDLDKRKTPLKKSSYCEKVPLLKAEYNLPD